MTMRAMRSSVVLTFVMIAGFGVPTLQAQPKRPRSSAHEAAAQRCTDEYEARAAAAHAPNSPTGKARMRAMQAAAEAKKACVARTPK